jgi:hypothetical protein
MLALAGTKALPGVGVIVPSGVTLPARGAEDAVQVQSLGARFAHDLVSLDYAATMGCSRLDRHLHGAIPTPLERLECGGEVGQREAVGE